VAWYSSEPPKDRPDEEHASTKRSDRDAESEEKKEGSRTETGFGEQNLGAMSRRLQEATEEALLTGGQSGRRAIEDAGFSDELKEKLLNKIADAKFKKEFSGALAEAGVTRGGGGVSSTSHIANSGPWTGEEPTADAVLRMLEDAHKPLKPELRDNFQLGPIDARLTRKSSKTPGQRAASAKDKVSVYTGMGIKDSEGLSEKERTEVKEQLQDRFRPEGRGGPVMISAIASLANQRIEDAIARGQFKDIPRGQEREKDARTDNPFVDTTEYLMNRIIKRQDIVPPWIEKQQELVKRVDEFRQRLRSDWKRHAARMIASKGGSLLEQMKRAEQYAAAEQVHNPLQRSVDQIPVPPSATDDSVFKMQPQVERVGNVEASNRSETATESGPLASPFRDLEWEKAEHKYMELSIDNLNGMMRSYNLMAPDAAKKPYFSLQRELAACYASVAPLLANEIKVRATRPTSTSLGSVGPVVGDGEGIMERFTGRDNVQIHVEADEKAYGLKEWWRDFWKSK
jgi:hypothetical protein